MIWTWYGKYLIPHVLAEDAEYGVQMRVSMRFGKMLYTKAPC